MFVLLPSSCPIIFQISRAVFPVLAQAIRQFVNRHKKLLLLVNGFDCVLLDVAIQRQRDIELQRATGSLAHMHFLQPGLPVACLHSRRDRRILGSLPDIQAPYTAYFVGAVIAIFYPVGAPLSGMSTNPARSFGPAAQADCWHACGSISSLRRWACWRPLRHFFESVRAPLHTALSLQDHEPSFRRRGVIVDNPPPFRQLAEY